MLQHEQAGWQVAVPMWKSHGMVSRHRQQS